MKFTAIILSILCAVQVSAQVRYSFDGDKPVNTEPTRREILPYNKVRVIAGDNDKYAYIAMPTAWNCTKTDGRTEYTSSFSMPLSWLNRQIILRIGYSSAAFEVEVNGKKVGYSPDGMTATEFNITKYAHDGSNRIAIIQHDDARANEIYKGVKSGISDIKIICQPTIRVRDIICDTRLNDDGDGIAEFGIVVKCDALNPKRTKLNYTIRLRDTVILAEGNRELELDMRREDTVRFAVRIPKQALWSAGNPEMLRLDIINRIDGRIAECISREIGTRSIDVNGNAMYVNGRIVKLYLAEYCAATEIGNIAASGYNGVIVSSDKASEPLLDECDRRGIYVMTAGAIDTSAEGASIRRGGNPSNEPTWRDTYILRNEKNYHTMKSHPSVIGYIIGKGGTTGINVYESYLRMKSLENRLPILYEGANGEWCTDKVKIR